MIKLLIYVFGSVRLKIEDICESVSSGKSKSRATEGKYPVYGSTGIIAKTETAMYFKDNILVARVGANAGYVHMAHGEYDVSDNTLIIDVLDNYNQKYVFYLLEKNGRCSLKNFVNYQYECERPSSCIRQKR